VLAAGRLDAMKRFHLLVEALAATRQPLRAVIAGEGPEREALEELARRRGVAARVELVGRVGDQRLAELYRGALAVFYAPFDEDYGYVTVEAFTAARPVVTTADAGGVLEFVADGENGLIAAVPTAAEVARQLDRLYEDRGLARRLGAAGRQRVAGIGWDQVIERLTATL
jgi:glycosyltransferase involved in cell wall biosynthesis